MTTTANNYMRHGAAKVCAFHGRFKQWTRNIRVEGVVMGEYHCPAERCESAADYGQPQAEAEVKRVGYTG